MSKLYSYFPEFLYEGIIQEVDYKNNTCKVAPLSPRKDSVITNVSIPHHAGSGNAGMWTGHLKVGSRVIVANTSGQGQEFSVIIGSVPQSNLFSDIFNANKPAETPSGIGSYPDMAEGRMILRGELGSEVVLNEKGEIYIRAGGGGAGEYFKKYGLKSVAAYRTIQEDSEFTNAGRAYSGIIRRLAANKRNFFPKTTLNDAPLFVDLDFHTVASAIAFFNGSKPYKYTYGNKRRNPELAESRWIINEFSTESMFTGFDDEVQRAGGSKKQFENSESHDRYREPSNNLQLSEGELIEFIGGNLVDLKGNILDINYQKLAYGAPGNKAPKGNLEESYEEAKRISRRGIGMHLQLSTNVVSQDISTSENSFLVDVDKEGLLRLSVPKSSDTGNIPFPALTVFEDGNGNITSSYSNPTKVEPIPVLLRDAQGIAVIPVTNTTVRSTGIRYANSSDNPYFPSATGGDGTSTIRVNTTKYHNMYSIAERLIANNISEIVIPQSFVNDDGVTEGNLFGKPFEVFDETEEDSDLIGDLIKQEFQTPTYMSVVKVIPDAPAIYSGGDTFVAGSDLTDDNKAPAFSNSFILERGDGNNLEAKIADPQFGDEKARIGGKSAILNFEGSIETSIGKDNTDQKSIILDTAGSLIAWLGKDRNGRSLVLQTDGELLVNVGGSYEGSDADDQTMNVGKFVLRVNVTDKKFVGTEFEPDEFNPKAQSDFIISISEEGLVIAGMKAGAPMVFRNEGKILIESATELVLKGQKVEQVDAKGKSTTPNVTGRG